MGGDGGGGGGGGAILPPEEEEQKPPKPNNHIFTKGCSVEVLTEDHGFKGVFFTATVIETSPSSASSKQKLLVQYHNLLADEGGPERLVEYVDISLVRPEPPSLSQERAEGFEVGEVVDAFHNDGWWTGVVTRIVGGGERSRLRFTVSFSHPQDVRDFRASDIRPHWDWVDRAWIKPEKQVCSTPHIRRSSCVTKRCHSPQSRVCSPPLKRRMLRDKQQDQIDKTITEDPTSDSPSPRNPIDRRSSGRRRGRPRKTSGQTSLGKRRGRPRKNSFTDHLEASGEQTKENNPEIEEIVNIAPYSKFADNRSLSMSIEEMQPPPTIAFKSLNHENTENVRIERYKNRTNGEMLQEDSGNDLENNQQRNVSLPFVKNNNLWKTIESMDVFKRTPQSPHFMPLEKFGECLREGLAIGLMVTFASVVDKVSKLRFSDPQSIIGDILDALVDLENHGFDVEEVRKQVNDIFAMKDKHRDCLEKVKKLNNELVVRQYEKTRFCEEIDGIVKQMHGMTKQMQKLENMLFLAKSASAKADDDIAYLQSEIRKAEEFIKNAEDFSKLVNTLERNDA